MKKDDTTLLLIGGGIVLYLLYQNSQGVSAAQAQINATNLTAANQVANVNAIAGAGASIANDIGDIFG
jgi:hypothetical protein